MEDRTEEMTKINQLGEYFVLILQDKRTAATNMSTIDIHSTHLLGNMLAFNLHFGEGNDTVIGFSKNTSCPQNLSTIHCCKKSEGNKNLSPVNIHDYMGTLLAIPGVIAYGLRLNNVKGQLYLGAHGKLKSKIIAGRMASFSHISFRLTPKLLLL